MGYQNRQLPLVIKSIPQGIIYSSSHILDNIVSKNHSCQNSRYVRTNKSAPIPNISYIIPIISNCSWITRVILWNPSLLYPLNQLQHQPLLYKYHLTRANKAIDSAPRENRPMFLRRLSCPLLKSMCHSWNGRKDKES
jgi:hypothetical protein